MASWLRGTTWFQRIALLLLSAAVAFWAYRYAAGQDAPTELVVLVGLIAFYAFRRQLLWRVRNRLLLTFFLFGVVPLFLIYWMLEITAIMVLGQFASERVKHDLEARIERVQALSRDLALAAGRNAAAALLEELRNREPRLTAVVGAGDQTLLAARPGDPFAAAPDWIAPEFAGIFGSGGRYYLGANVREPNAQAFAYLQLDEEALATITPGVATVAAIISQDRDDVNTNVGFDPSGSRISITVSGGVAREVTSTRVPPPRNSWDLSIAALLPWDVQAEPDQDDDILFVVLSRPSQLLAGVITGRMASVVLSVLVIVGAFFLIVELVSLVSSVRLTRTITRSVHDLYQGTQYVAAGDFSHQIPVRGQHQLSDLAASFNSMTAQIRHYIGEMRNKEKLESELEIARQVQARLFPRVVPELKTLEMAGVCLPGRFVSGDYYDFVQLDSRFTAIALGDVSGKGVSAALLMASIQSSLHAQLRFSGAALNPSLSTAVLMGLISQQLYENTPAEKYATFFCSVYDDETGVLRYTNCGHLKPILIRKGGVSTLEGDGMVVGLLPKVSYEQREFELHSGDLVAIFSDGIPEAENAAQQEFGEARLGELLAGRSDDPLEKIIQAVTEAVHGWIHDPDGQDDTTIVLLRKR